MNALERFCLNNCRINTENLTFVFDALERYNCIDVDHVLSVVLGLKDMVREDSLPKLSTPDKRGKQECRLVEYNVLKDTVCYEYDNTHRLWFQNEEDAEKFSSGENYYGLKYTYSEKEDFKFPGERAFVDNGCCSAQEWIDNAVMVE